MTNVVTAATTTAKEVIQQGAQEIQDLELRNQYIEILDAKGAKKTGPKSYATTSDLPFPRQKSDVTYQNQP